MANPHLHRLLVAASLVIAFAVAADAGVGDSVWIGQPACHGSIAECMTDGDIDGEFEMDSESNRRILAATRKYVSYGAMRAGTIPCSVKGQSYYNCKSGKAANPYTRSCTAVTRCRTR